MSDILSELQTIGLTALFNPTFLFLLIVLFFLGRLVGWMTRNINVWKFLALAYFGIFLFRPLQDAGIIIGGVFILGVASMYLDLFRSIFRWSSSIGDVFSAFRYRSAFRDIERLEREVEDLKAQLRTAQAADGGGSNSSAKQSAWRAQSKARKEKRSSAGQASSGGRGDRSSANSSKGSRFSTGSTDGSSTRSKPDRSKSGSTSSKSGPRRKPRATSGDSSSDRTQQSKSNQSSKAKSSTRSSGASSSQGAKNASQSKSKQQSTGDQRFQGQTGSSSGQNAKPSLSPALRDKYLTVLELTPGRAYTEKEIKAAWRTMAFKTHPDRGGSAASFAEARAAYKALSL